MPGAWYSFTDDGNALLSPPPYPALFVYREIEPPVTLAAGAAPIHRAACLRSDGFSGFIAGEGFIFQRAPPDYLADPLDVSQHTGIRFWASAAAAAPGKLDLPTLISVDFPNVNTDSQNPKSDCNQAGGRAACDTFAETISLPADGNWAQYAVKWADLQQDGFGEQFPSFNTNVTNVNFSILGPGSGSRSLPFDFCVAQIEFTQD